MIASIGAGGCTHIASRGEAKNPSSLAGGGATIWWSYLPRRDGRYLVFCQYVDEVPILEEWLRYCLEGEVSDAHFYSVHYESADPEGEIERFVNDETDAIKFLTAINMVGDDDSMRCDGVLIARTAGTVNVYLRLVSQASQAGRGATVIDLQDSISGACDWSIDIEVDTEENRELRQLHAVVASAFGVRPRHGGNVGGTHRSGYRSRAREKRDDSPDAKGGKLLREASNPWAREEDDILIDCAPYKYADVTSWIARLPGRTPQEAAARARELGVVLGADKPSWTPSEDNVIVAHYPELGPNWEGWRDELPRRSTRDIVARARDTRVYVRWLPWTERDIESIRKYYEPHGPEWRGWRRCVPDHGVEQIQLKAQEMGLRHSKPADLSSEDLVRLLAAHSAAPNPFEEIPEADFPWDSVTNRGGLTARGLGARDGDPAASREPDASTDTP